MDYLLETPFEAMLMELVGVANELQMLFKDGMNFCNSAKGQC